MEQSEPFIDEEILGICMFVSVAFLVPTILVYGLLPEMRDLQGKCIVNFCINLAMSLLIMGIIKIHTAPSFAVCGVRAFLAYFFFLATFFWMNVISIQILVNISRPITIDRGWRKFWWMALYAYGVPTLLTVIMATVNFYPGNHSKPEIGLTNCWFYDSIQQWIYLYSFMAIIVLVNLVIFGYISYLLWGSKFSSNHVKALRYKFRMTFRLLIIMGLPWIFEMISSMSPPHIIWAITDIVNVLQGPLIFLLLVVLRKRVVKALYKRGYLDCAGSLVERCLAVGDDEEDVVEHTAADTLEL